MRNTIVPIAVIGLLLGGVLAVSRLYQHRKESVSTTSNRLMVVASLYPLADFAKQVGGELVTVTTITPPGAEPHDYEPTPQDLVKVYNAKIVLTNGHGIDVWADKLQDELRSKEIILLRMSDHVQSTSTDPHFWLDPANAAQEVTLIADAFMNADPEHAETYARQRDAYLQSLMALDQRYREGLADCQQRKIITSHDAFRYLGQRYGFATRSILGLSVEEDPSPQKMAELIVLAKQEQLQYIFFETLVNPKLAQTIADEIGAKTLVLNPIEGLTLQELQAGKDYIGVMQDNLTNLKMGLVCQ